MRIDKYFKGDEEALPSILEAILQRKLVGKHEDTDDELVEELRMKPLEDVKDKEVESDFEELYETDEEIDDLYNARDIVMQKMVKDEYFNMDDKKWDELVKDGMNHGILKDTKECEAILEDMLSWDKLLPGLPVSFTRLFWLVCNIPSSFLCYNWPSWISFCRTSFSLHSYISSGLNF